MEVEPGPLDSSDAAGHAAATKHTFLPPDAAAAEDPLVSGLWRAVLEFGGYAQQQRHGTLCQVQTLDLLKQFCRLLQPLSGLCRRMRDLKSR